VVVALANVVDLAQKKAKKIERREKKARKRDSESDASSDEYDEEDDDSESDIDSQELDADEDLEITEQTHYSAMPEPWSLDCEGFGTVFLFKRLYSVCFLS
jgi:hypothetical protein